MRFLRFRFFACSIALFATGCTEYGGPIGPETPKPLPASMTIAVGESRTFNLATKGDSFYVSIPPAVAGSGNLTVTASTASVQYEPVSTGITGPGAVSIFGTAIAFVTLTVDKTATYDTFPTPGFTLPADVTSSTTYALVFSDSLGHTATVAGPVTATPGMPISFSPATFLNDAALLPFTLTAGNTYVFALYAQ